MQCPSCGFHNLPGSTACGRCASPLGGAVAVDVMPPRAGAARKRLRRAVPVRRTYYRFRDGLAAAGTVADRQMPTFARAAPSGVLLRAAVPGWAHFHIGQRERAWLFLGVFLLCLGLGLLDYGGTWGAIGFGLAFSVHSGEAADIVTQTFADAGLRDRMLRGLAVSVVLYLAVYWPASHTLAVYAQPHTINTVMAPFVDGDVVVVDAAAAPAVGRTVLFDYQSRDAERPRVGRERAGFEYTGEAIDRIVAGPNDRVEWDGGRLTVDGRPARATPLNPVSSPRPATVTLGPDQFLVLPSGVPGIGDRIAADPDAVLRSGVLSSGEMHGRVFARTSPLRRWRWF